MRAVRHATAIALLAAATCGRRLPSHPQSSSQNSSRSSSTARFGRTCITCCIPKRGDSARTLVEAWRRYCRSLWARNDCRPPSNKHGPRPLAITTASSRTKHCCSTSTACATPCSPRAASYRNSASHRNTAGYSQPPRPFTRSTGGRRTTARTASGPRLSCRAWPICRPLSSTACKRSTGHRGSTSGSVSTSFACRAIKGVHGSRSRAGAHHGFEQRSE